MCFMKLYRLLLHKQRFMSHIGAEACLSLTDSGHGLVGQDLKGGCPCS